MYKSNMNQARLAYDQRSLLSVELTRLLIATILLLLLPMGNIHAQVVQLNRTIYISKFTCGNQTQFSITSPTPLEPGRYSTSFAVFNPNTNPLSGLSAFSSIPGQSNVLVRTFNLPSFGTALIDCSDILNTFGVSGTPNAVVGYIYVRRGQDDLEVQTTFSRTAVVSRGVGAAIDVEKVEPRPVRLLKRQ